MGSIAIGALLIATAIFSNLAVALPWDRLFTRSGFWSGVLAIGAGAAIARRGRGTS